MVSTGAYPFDHIRSTFAGVVDCIENDFAHFFPKKIEVDTIKYSYSGRSFRGRYFGFYHHDLLNADVIADFRRRIDRFGTTLRTTEGRDHHPQGGIPICTSGRGVNHKGRQLRTNPPFRQMEKLGTKYGGWYVPEDMDLDNRSVIYSGGVGEDISFDLLLADKYGCGVVLIDPTAKAVRHFDEVQAWYQDHVPFTGGIQEDYCACIEAVLQPKFDMFEYLPIGLWDKKDTLKFYKQTNDSFVSQSLLPGMFGQKYDTVPVDSIKGVMERRNDTHIDLLKLDIEGAEIEAVNQMLDDGILPRYVLIEFDLLLKKKDPDRRTRKLVCRMLQMGYDVLKDDNLNITFGLRH